MSVLKLTRRGFVASGSALATLAATAGLPRAQAASGRLRYRSYLAIESLDPAYRVSVPDGEVIENLFRGLITYQPGDRWEWALDAAEEFEILDDTHIRFALRSGLGWTNGFGEVTADDVKFSFERIADPAMESPYRNDWAALDRVDVTGPRSGMIVLKHPFVPLMTTTVPTQSGVIVCKAAVEAMEGKRFDVRPPAVCGPYEIAELVDRQSVTLRARADWGGETPAFNEVHFIAIPDYNAAEIAFRAEELDCTHIPLTSAPRFRTEAPADTTMVVRPSLAYVWLGMQMEEGVFADPRVRRAVQHALDVDAILEGVYYGEADRATGIIAPGLIGHREANLYSRDLDRARALLAEAGHPNGFKTDIKVRNITEQVNIGQIIAASLADVGIEVEVIPLDAAILRNYGRGPNGEWREMAMYISRFTMQPDPSWATEWFTGVQIGQWNYSRFNNAEFDSLHAAATVEADAVKRHAMYVRMQDLMEESGAYVFLTHGANAYVHRNDIRPAFTADGQRAIAYRFGIA